MLRIDHGSGDDGHLRLEGRMVGPWTNEVRACCERARAGGAEVVIDLGGVQFVDGAAAALLRDLAARGTRFVNASPFLQELLRARP